MSSSSYDYYYNYGENSTNVTYYEDSSLQKSRLFSFPLGFEIFVYLIYNTVFVLAVGGNLLVFWVVVSSVRMRTVTNYLIANLALGDLLMALLTVPFSYISILKQYWPFGLVLCHVVSPAQAVCVFVSAYTLIALAIDRYMAILYPLRPRLRKSQTLIVIGVVWIVAVFTAAPIAIFTRLEPEPITGLPLCDEFAWPSKGLKMVYGLALLTLQYFFPITVLIYTYSRIVLEIWWKKKPLGEDGEVTRVFEESRDHTLAKARRKTVVMTLTVVVGYTLAWLPQNISLLYSQTLLAAEETEASRYELEEDSVIYPYIFFICHWPAMAHTMYNPLIYAWVNSKFRDAFANAFRCSCNRKKVNLCPTTRRTAAAVCNGTAAAPNNNRRGTVEAIGNNNTPPMAQFQRDNPMESSSGVINVGGRRSGCADDHNGGGNNNRRKTVPVVEVEELAPSSVGHVAKVGVAVEDISRGRSSNYNNNRRQARGSGSRTTPVVSGESSSSAGKKGIPTEEDRNNGDCWRNGEDEV